MTAMHTSEFPRTAATMTRMKKEANAIFPASLVNSSHVGGVCVVFNVLEQSATVVLTANCTVDEFTAIAI